jgi:inorganic pyrophosphatase/exopolyphosphatase
MIKVFGHKSPDTDSTGSPIIWAWYLTEVKGTPAALEPAKAGVSGRCHRR